jgi:demethylmenaquinone methyltransferase/2-methoxy-6-polyprenyl-1,4-benzoquinol methylase
MHKYRVGLRDDGRMTEELLSGQADYYRRRAREYDATAYGDLVAARARIARLVAELQPTGTVLEIACGTGMWTEALAPLAESLTAIDIAPEAVAIARDRVATGHVTFEVADVFAWSTPARFDVIFFSAWLSHVPRSRFTQFWQLLRGLLADGGRVMFVDEHVDERAKEKYLPGTDEVVERRLSDGTAFRIVKNFLEPEELAARLRALGWECRIRRDGTDWVWVYGVARPV